MNCAICAAPMRESFSATVMHRYNASYQLCSNCGLLAVREPFWLEEAYSRAIATADTGLVRRNLELSSKVAGALYWLAGERGEGRYLDLAGGYGLLTRLMRDIGFDFYWSDKYCENLIAPGFEFRDGMGPCKAVTAFEVLEHLADPLPFIEESLARHGAEYFIFTTELYQGAPPLPAEWNYYAFATGQHVTFYQRRTLEKLAARLGLHFASANGLHLFSRRAVSEASLGLVTGWAAPVAALWVRYRLGSRTVRDQELMLGIG